MDWVNALNEMKKARGYTTDDIVRMSKISKGTLNKIFAGQTKDPQLSTIRTIVHAMGYTLDDLDKSSHVSPQPPHYSDLLDEYRAIVDVTSDQAYKAQTLAFKAALTAMQEDAADTPDNVIPLRCSEQAFSAGHGVYLGPEAFDTINVMGNELTRRATFCGPVSGDSMEPKYHNGDILLVNADEEVEVGDIGIFTLDGHGYVKKRGYVDLVSLNSAYSPIPLDDSIRCNGKVIGILDPDWIVEK